jgi:hypothetical protein
MFLTLALCLGQPIVVENKCPACPECPALTVTNKCPAAVKTAPVRTGYPLRGPNETWWDMGTVKQGRNVVRLQPTAEHLAQGQHKFPMEWLKTLSQAELTALHSDDHEGRVKWDYVSVRASTKTASPSPPPVVRYTLPSLQNCPPGASH